MCDLHQLGGDLLGEEDQVHDAGRDRGARHTVVACRFRRLREHDSAGGLHLADADRPVGGGAGEDDGDGALLRGLREAAEEEVDRRVLCVVGRTRVQVERLVEHPHLHVGRDHVDVVPLDPHALERMHDRELGAGREQGRKGALVLRREMGDQHDRNPRIGG